MTRLAIILGLITFLDEGVRWTSFETEQVLYIHNICFGHSKRPEVYGSKQLQYMKFQICLRDSEWDMCI